MNNIQYERLFDGIHRINRCKNSIDFIIISPLSDKYQRIKYRPVVYRDATWDIKIEAFSQKLFHCYLRNEYYSKGSAECNRWDRIARDFTYDYGWYVFDNITADSPEEYINNAKIAYLAIKDRISCRIDIYAKEYVFKPEIKLKHPIDLKLSDLKESDLVYLNNKIDVFINKCKDSFDEIIIGKIASDCALTKREIYDNEELIDSYREIIKIKSFLYSKNTLLKIESHNKL
jgi:hypothetical protein